MPKPMSMRVPTGAIAAPVRRASQWRVPALLLAAALCGFPAGAAEPAPANVTIYRCVDSRGQLVALRDSPCRAGERQETVQMQRPQDPPPRAASTAAPPAPSPAPEREVRVVTVQPPQPVYECTAPDGSSYTSDTGQGTARWVPLWAVGYPMWPSPPRPGPPPRPPGPPSPRPEAGAEALPGRWPPHPGPGPRPPPPSVVVPAGGTWVNDPCVRLPQQEVCRRLSDRRFEILRIYHAAMPSGRAELDREQRVIDARMATDCPGS